MKGVLSLPKTTFGFTNELENHIKSEEHDVNLGGFPNPWLSPIPIMQMRSLVLMRLHVAAAQSQSAACNATSALHQSATTLLFPLRPL